MISADFKAMFFDRQKVTDPAAKAELRVLSRMGAFVMTTDRQSIKDKPGPSAPGTPPHAHTRIDAGTTKSGRPKRFYPFKASILFGYDSLRKTMLVGPQFRAGSRTRPTVPQALEFGGTIQGDGRTIRALKKPGRDSRGRFVTGGYESITLAGAMRIRPRPHTGPALQKNLPKFAGLFRSSINGG